MFSGGIIEMPSRLEELFQLKWAWASHRPGVGVAPGGVDHGHALGREWSGRRGPPAGCDCPARALRPCRSRRRCRRRCDAGEQNICHRDLPRCRRRRGLVATPRSCRRQFYSNAVARGTPPAPMPFFRPLERRSPVAALGGHAGARSRQAGADGAHAGGRRDRILVAGQQQRRAFDRRHVGRRGIGQRLAAARVALGVLSASASPGSGQLQPAVRAGSRQPSRPGRWRRRPAAFPAPAPSRRARASLAVPRRPAPAAAR